MRLRGGWQQTWINILLALGRGATGNEAWILWLLCLFFPFASCLTRHVRKCCLLSKKRSPSRKERKMKTRDRQQNSIKEGERKTRKSPHYVNIITREAKKKPAKRGSQSHEILDVDSISLSRRGLVCDIALSTSLNSKTEREIFARHGQANKTAFRQSKPEFLLCQVMVVSGEL